MLLNKRKGRNFNLNVTQAGAWVPLATTEYIVDIYCSKTKFQQEELEEWFEDFQRVSKCSSITSACFNLCLNKINYVSDPLPQKIVRFRLYIKNEPTSWINI